MDEYTYQLTDQEYAEALRAAFKASLKARFVDDRPDEAEELTVQAGIAKAKEIAARRTGGEPV